MSALVIEIVLGLALIGALVWVLRWAWNSREQQGKTSERVDALEKAVFIEEDRHRRARGEESIPFEAWKKAGRARRRKRKPS